MATCSVDLGGEDECCSFLLIVSSSWETEEVSSSRGRRKGRGLEAQGERGKESKFTGTMYGNQQAIAGPLDI